MLLDFLKKDDGRDHRPIEPPLIPAELPRKPARTSIELREQLGCERDSLLAVSAKLEAARQELAAEQTRFDAGIEKFAIGDIQEQPDRGGLQAAISIFDALKRIHAATQERVTRLTSELADVELAEAIAEGRERLPAIIGAVEARLADFERALTAAAESEKQLFELLFNERTGLKQRFVGTELAAEANRSRARLKARAIKLAESYRFGISKRFSVDGEMFLGDEFETVQHLAIYRGGRR